MSSCIQNIRVPIYFLNPMGVSQLHNGYGVSHSPMTIRPNWFNVLQKTTLKNAPPRLMSPRPRRSSPRLAMSRPTSFLQETPPTVLFRPPTVLVGGCPSGTRKRHHRPWIGRTFRRNVLPHQGLVARQMVLPVRHFRRGRVLRVQARSAWLR